eukprot:1418333-Rhodomonas_salina.1
MQAVKKEQCITTAQSSWWAFLLAGLSRQSDAMPECSRNCQMERRHSKDAGGPRPWETGQGICMMRTVLYSDVKCSCESREVSGATCEVRRERDAHVLGCKLQLMRPQECGERVP